MVWFAQMNYHHHNHNDVRRVLTRDDAVVSENAESEIIESVHVAPFQFTAADDDDDRPPSQFAMKIFAASRPPPGADDSPSPTADATPSPPPPDSVQFPANSGAAEPPSELPESSSRRQSDDDDAGGARPTGGVERPYSTSHSDLTSDERRRSKDVSPPLPASHHASHCANPVCLRERLLDRPSSSALSPLGDMCSHRLAMSSSPDHGRVRVAVVQRQRCSPAGGHDVDGGSLPGGRPPSTGVRTPSRRSSSSRTPDYCFSLPPRRLTDSGDQLGARPVLGHRVLVDTAGSTMPRQRQRTSTANDRRAQRELTSSAGGQLSGSSSALDIRDLEISTSGSPHTMTSRAKSPAAAQSGTVATSLHDILSPPFGPPTANGPKPTTGNALNILKLQPGEQDEFGTAV